VKRSISDGGLHEPISLPEKGNFGRNSVNPNRKISGRVLDHAVNYAQITGVLGSPGPWNQMKHHN
jgi:hypothetical protein